MAKDRLDGSDTSSILYELFSLPGRIMLWMRYMNPKPGKVRQSARRAKSPIMTFIYSLIFWLLTAFITYSVLYGDTIDTKPTHTKPTTHYTHGNEYEVDYNDDNGIER